VEILVHKRRAKHMKKPRVIEMPGQQMEYKIIPRWVDITGRTPTWTLLSPAGDRIADTTTKRGAKNLVYLLSKTSDIKWQL
jgi:hypothetical protein